MNTAWRTHRSSFWIFIKCAGEWSDEDLLREFGLTGYQRANLDDEFAAPPLLGYPRHVSIGSSGAWTCIADDGFYTLWNMPATLSTLKRLCALNDVLAYFLADCDDTFGLVYYRDGQLARELFVVDRSGSGDQEVDKSFGEPLVGESQTLSFSDFLRGVSAIGESLGFATNYAVRDLRFYTKPF